MVVARRAAGLVLGALTAITLVIGLSACGSSATTEQSDSGSDAGESGSTSESPSETGTPPDDDMWMISLSGIGPFEIGMRYADALTTPSADVSELCEGVAQTSVPESVDLSMWVIASERDPASTLSEISISAPADTIEDIPSGPETEKGIGLGSTATELVDAYPDARELDDTGVPGRIMYYVQAGDGGGMIFTTTAESEAIWQISITTGETPAYEPCA
ncbi:hypothetical protein [Paramicrobacterium fandaimingii]|uniref:hypothetical protein n=1 Tax=Paramicrobacterium fandaimingii TaxID=2708079 RepID=UPI00141E5374|nr:hypothetical protein [Microbacterium fandaimingii]